MTGIQRQITVDTRISLIEKHLPGTDKAQRELEREGKVYIFKDLQTMLRVAEDIKSKG